MVSFIPQSKNFYQLLFLRKAQRFNTGQCSEISSSWCHSGQPLAQSATSIQCAEVHISNN